MTAPPTQHRIFLAPLLSGSDREQGLRHWVDRHAGVFAATPGLRGYVQHRPVGSYWATAPFVCSETWFDDRDAERAAFTSPYYAGEVTADERRFVDRPAAWAGRVTRQRPAGRLAALRVLAFGVEPDLLPSGHQGSTDVLELATVPPGCAVPVASCVWTDDEDVATGLAAALAGHGRTVFVARPAAVVPPPVPPWAAAREPGAVRGETAR